MAATRKQLASLRKARLAKVKMGMASATGNGKRKVGKRRGGRRVRGRGLADWGKKVYNWGKSAYDWAKPKYDELSKSKQLSNLAKTASDWGVPGAATAHKALTSVGLGKRRPRRKARGRGGRSTLKIGLLP